MPIKIVHCKSVLAEVQRRGSSAPELQHHANPWDHLIIIQLDPDVKIMTYDTLPVSDGRIWAELGKVNFVGVEA